MTQDTDPPGRDEPPKPSQDATAPERPRDPFEGQEFRNRFRDLQDTGDVPPEQEQPLRDFVQSYRQEARRLKSAQAPPNSQ